MFRTHVPIPCSTFGDGIAAGYDQLWGVLSHGQYFGIQAIIMILASLVFGMITRKERVGQDSRVGPNR
jgi:hypothetical protein